MTNTKECTEFVERELAELQKMIRDKIKTLLVIYPGRDSEYRNGVFTILHAETGEGLASHLCSNYSFAYGDLIGNRPERIEAWEKRFGELEVKFIDETDITEDELFARNQKWAKEQEGVENDKL